MISAIILAAGESRRMGQPKMLLPWGSTTVLGQVLRTFQGAGVEDIVVITGGAHDRVEPIAREHGARSVYNSHFSHGEMLSSLQLGLEAQDSRVQATLIGLGDQPQVQAATIQTLCATFAREPARLIVPSFAMRRGHPWLVARSLWDSLLEMKLPQSARDFLNAHQEEIRYVNFDTPSILADLDTPADYQTSHPE